jgi:ammonium transporter, Amt family
VHANAGAAALAMAILLGRRRGWPERTGRPHNLPMVMIGLAMLWVGWLGFNGGSAYGANELGAALLKVRVVEA